jgi:hypothetical protein
MHGQQNINKKNPDLVPLMSSFELSIIIGSRDSIIGIVTSYGVEGPEIEYRQGQRFSLLHTSISSAKVKNQRSYNSAPRICLCGLDNRGKVTFFLFSTVND